MKKLILLICALMFLQIAQAETIKAGISIEHVPKALYGSWRVSAMLDRINAPRTFKPQSLDFWNLSRLGDIIELNNPMSGANAEISVQTVEGNIVVFSKRLPYDDNKILTDTVTIRLNQNTFSGINQLKLEHFSLIDNHLMKTQTATYHIKGEKISGDSVIEEDINNTPLDNTSF